VDLLVDKEEDYVADVDGNMGLVNNDLSPSSKELHSWRIMRDGVKMMRNSRSRICKMCRKHLKSFDSGQLF